MFTSTLTLKCIARRKRRGKPYPALRQITWTMKADEQRKAAWHRSAIDLLNTVAILRRQGHYRSARSLLKQARAAIAYSKGALP